MIGYCTHMSIGNQPEIRRSFLRGVSEGRTLVRVSFACAFFCLLLFTGATVAAFQRVGILSPGEDDCLIGTIVVEFDKDLGGSLPSDEEIRNAENMVRAELELEGIGDFNYSMKVSRTAAGKMIMMHIRPVSEAAPEESPSKKCSHIFYIQNGALRRIEKIPNSLF